MTSLACSGNKRALLVGINQYEKPYITPLHGCINDIALMADILCNNFGFSEENVKFLRDSEATRAGILSALDVLIDDTGENDIVVIHYSGHGSQMRDREGDEPDGFDETIVPYDSGRYEDPNRDITDDEIYGRLLRLSQKTTYITLIFDCCHAGTIVRDPFGMQMRWVERDQRSIDHLPASPITQEEPLPDKQNVGPSGWLPLGDRYVLIAGCRDEERSCEYLFQQGKSAVPHGMLTYFLCQELATSQPGTTYRDVFERAATQLAAIYTRQHPQMEGARDREIFGVRDIEPMRFVAVKERMHDRVVLSAGAAHGMTVGSEWAIYSQATKQVVDETANLGMVEITQVHATTSDAQILTEHPPDTIVAYTRAVEETHFYGEMRLIVDIHAPADDEQAVADVAGLIEQSALLRRPTNGEVADVRAHLLAPRTLADAATTVPQVPVVAEPTWAVVGQDGQLIMPLHPGTEVGVARILCENLEKRARYRQALALHNANPAHLLKGRVTLELLRQSDAGAWVKAETDVAGGAITFHTGERIAFEITNFHDQPVYISVLDFGLTGAINLLHPIAGASEALKPGNTIQVGVRPGDELILGLPANFPFVPIFEGEKPIGGTETYKLFATTHEADFSGLVQQHMRDSFHRGHDSPLGQLLGVALTGQGHRDTQRNRVAPDEEWTTVTRSFFLQSSSD
ncbi:MAG: caspase family protein [Caldilineaceae bacterium]|nr:caspase family protein [Caldilineaceae bacterium]